MSIISNSQTSSEAANAARLATIRRLYFYFIAFVSLLVGLFSLTSLLQILLDVWLSVASPYSVNNAAFIRNAVARSGGLLLVATPIFVIHWAYIRRLQSQPDETQAALRKLFLYATSAVTLGVAAENGRQLIADSTKVVLGLPLQESALWPSRWLYLILAVLVNVLLLVYFQRQAATDSDWGHERHWAGSLRRLFHAGVGLVGLWLLIFGGGSVLEVLWRLLLQTAQVTVEAGWWRNAVGDGTGMLLVGALLWRYNWLRWGTITDRNEEEGKTGLRRFYLYASVVISALATLVPAAGLLREFLLRLFGGETFSVLEDLAPSLAYLPLGVIAWIWHWRQVQQEAVQYGDSSESATVRRLYYYLVAATGLVLLWFGLVDILRAALDWLLVGTGTASGGFRAEQVANGLSLLAVGAPVWAIHWRTVQQVAQQPGAVGQAERSSGPRRAYLYGVALAGALLILFDLALVVYRLLLWLLGDPNADLFGPETLDSLVRSGTALVFWLIDVLAIRRDSRLTQTAPPGEVLSPEERAAQRARLADRIQTLETELATARAELAALEAEREGNVT